MRNKSVMEKMLDAMENTGEAALRLQMQRDMMMQAYYDRKEREALVDEVAARVIANIHATVDAQEIFDAIDGLNEKIKSLGR